MRNSIYILVLITLFSCKNEGLKMELENAYRVSSKYQNDSIIIQEFEILNKETVDFDYAQNIKINSLNNVIELKKSVIKKDIENIKLLEKNILNRIKLIELNETKKEQYLAEIEYEKQRLEKSRNYIKKIEDEIAIISQKIVLTQAEFGQNKDKFELINYVFNGKINDKNRIDTLSLLKVSENEIVFIKNGKFSNYKGE